MQSSLSASEMQLKWNDTVKILSGSLWWGVFICLCHLSHEWKVAQTAKCHDTPGLIKRDWWIQVTDVKSVLIGPLPCVLMLFDSTLGMFWSLFAVMCKCCHLLLMSTVWMRSYWFSNWALIADSFVSAAWKLWFQLGGKMSRRLVTGENTRRQPQTLTFLA